MGMIEEDGFNIINQGTVPTFCTIRGIKNIRAM